MGGDGAGPRFGKSDLARLGRLLAEERVAAGLTLRALSTRCGVSTGSIRALEAGRSNPGLATVAAIVAGLGLSLDRMVQAVRAGRAGTTSLTRAGSGDADLSAGLAEPVLSARIVTLPGESLQRPPPDTARRASFALVVAGRVLATTATGERVHLDPGDSYHARPGQVAAWANGGARPSRLVHVVDTRGEDQSSTS
ncbi:MAG: helix-turn-helix domain-containing protein [Rhodobacteraceae bacterium]|jgi:transcriptional regulator with XRE-family HTH domain|nr:helix-turn-helix domain-containing protein [Paracoccaceae bacterium]